MNSIENKVLFIAEKSFKKRLNIYRDLLPIF